IAAADLAQPRGQTIAATMRGSLRGKGFEGSFSADTVERVLRERQTPFHFTGASAGVRLRLSGVLAEPGADSGPDIEVELSAPQARELAPWLGFSSQSADAVALGGRVRVRENGVKLGAGSLVFGRSSIKGELEWQRADGKTRVAASLAAELLAPAELRGLREAPAPGGRRTLVDLPILPQTLDFGDADLELTVQGVHGLALDLTDLAFSGRLRDGALEPSPLSLRLQGNPLAGTLALDARGASPTASLSLEGDDFDAGAVLRRLRLAQDIDARIGKLHLRAAVRGSRLGEAVEQLSFQASVEAGTLAYRDPGTQAVLPLALAGGELRAEAGGPVTGSISGTAGDVPVRLDLQGGPLGELLAPAGRWPFALTAALPEAQWVVSGSAAPGREPATELSLALSGRRLSDLDALLATALPPWGPYAFTGRLRFARNAYQVEDARIAIGESVLFGSGSLDTGRSPPRLEAALAAPIVQLDDFPLGAWSPLPGSRLGPAGRMSARAAGRAFSGGVATVHPLLSRERLALGDAQVEVRVERLLAGADELGRAGIAASVVNGAAALGPIEIDGPAGRASLAIGYEPREQDAVFSARVSVDRLDYGLVAALLDPAADIDGAFSLDLAVDAVTPELNRLMETASGHVDLAVWPERVRWGGFDLWAGNLLRSLLPFFSRTSSHINCVIGHFDLDRGALSSQALIVDTTNTRALGWAEADFATERLHLRFVPRHKQPRLFSLAIPVEVRGTFSDYRIALRPADALGRVAQWFKSLVMVPLSWIGVGRLPSDGHDVCAEPSRR
ncbi:MAG: AsmA-like C-terminal region-containing protein, partial [Xanthomonadales bacterium]|nr:AsmA-like C-terminal region-containing protein [Xanthomonadales bacterium]